MTEPTDFDRMLDCFTAIHALHFVVRGHMHGTRLIFPCAPEQVARFRTCDIYDLIGHYRMYEFDEIGTLISY